MPSTSIQSRGASVPFFFFVFSFKRVSTFLRPRAENLTHLLGSHSPSSAVFAYNLAFQVRFPLKGQKGFPSHIALNEPGEHLPSPSSQFLPSFSPSSPVTISHGFPHVLGTDCDGEPSRVVAPKSLFLLICLLHSLPSTFISHHLSPDLRAPQIHAVP